MLRSLRLTASLVLCLCSTSAAQSDAALEKFTRYLDRDPFHEQVFQRMTHAAVESIGLEALRAEYTDRLVAEPDSSALRVVLARLEALAGNPRGALEGLADIRLEGPGLLTLRARLYLSVGELELAAEALSAAADEELSLQRAGEILSLLGRTLYRLDELSAAAEAYRRFAELVPGSVSQSLEAAALMEEAGLQRVALDQLDRTLELASGDPENEVRTHVAIGRLEERRGSTERAAEAYAAAAGLVGPGHWQRGELFERRMALHEALGTDQALLEELEQATRGSVPDPEAFGYLARVNRARGESAAARTALERGVERFPGDLSLGRAYADSLARAGETLSAVREYRRLAGQHPERRGLHREAGVLLASMGSMPFAAREWERELELGVDDVGLQIEVAELFARFDMQVRAEQLVLGAHRSAPTDLRSIRALARLWGAGGGRLVPYLEAVERAAAQASDEHALEEIALEWVALEDSRRAFDAMQLALEAGADRRRLLRMSATMLTELGDERRLVGVLAELQVTAPTPEERLEDTQQYVDHLARLSRLERSLTLWKRGLVREPQDLNTRLLLSTGLVRLQQFDEAAGVLRELDREGERAIDRAWHLAWLEERRGDFEAAIIELRRLIGLRASKRRVLLTSIARLYRRAGQTDKAQAVDLELLDLASSNPSLLSELAEDALRARDLLGAAGLLERSVQLFPNDDEARLDLAELRVNLGKTEEAYTDVLRLLRSDSPDVRSQTRQLVRDRILPRASRGVEQMRLEAELEAAPTSVGAAAMLSILHIANFDFGAARTVSENMLIRFPREAVLLELREELRGLTVMSAHDPLPRRLRSREDAQLVGLMLNRGDVLAARKMLERFDSVSDAANICLFHSAPEEAQRVLQRAVRRQPDDLILKLRLAVAGFQTKDSGAAVRELSLAASRLDYPWALTLESGQRHLARGDRRSARLVGEQLIRLLPQTLAQAEIAAIGRRLHQRRVEELIEFYSVPALERDFLRSAEAYLLDHPGDPPLLDAVLARMKPFHKRRALVLLRRAEVLERPPRGWSVNRWRKMLEGHRQRIAGR